MGGVSTLTMLRGTPEQVQAEAQAVIRKAGGGGGYIMAAGCMVPRDTPEENMQAMVRAAHEFGRYSS
jgi:uroporphyrinogen decarboxylase